MYFLLLGVGVGVGGDWLTQAPIVLGNSLSLELIASIQRKWKEADLLVDTFFNSGWARTNVPLLFLESKLKENLIVELVAKPT